MNVKSFLRKRRFLAISTAILVATVKALRWFFHFVFAKRTVLIVTNQKIRSVTLGPVLQLCVFVFIGFVANVAYQTMQYSSIINDKSQEIARLEGTNAYFETELNNINKKLKKVNEYLVSITGYGTLASDRKQDFVMPQNVKEDDLSSADKETVEQIKEASQRLSDMQEMAAVRINKIERSIAVTGLNIKKPSNHNVVNAENSANVGQGGPLIPIGEINDLQGFARKKNIDAAKFADEIDRLIMLERLTQVMPLARPIKSYFVSSGFGRRVDPITGGHAAHLGLDLVGPNHEKIISPSNGRVVLAGAFSGYGNAVVIDHGFGISTRYGHLYAIKVKEGQVVKKGDVIALQGNTGRSTGQHLHYEVRYKNIPLDPKKFLKAGDLLFNDAKSYNYANS